MFSKKRVTDILSIIVLNYIYHDCKFLNKKLGNLHIGIIIFIITFHLKEKIYQYRNA